MGHPVDVHVGARIRQRRWLIGMSQQALAEHLGVTFQQVQKYEIGANRVSASRLWEIARLLEVPVEAFFEGLVPEHPRPGEAPPNGGARRATPASGTGRPGAIDAAEGLGPVTLDRDAATLLRSFGAIPAAKRRRLLDLARALSEHRS